MTTPDPSAVFTIRGARVLTMSVREKSPDAALRPARGAALNDLGIIDHADVTIDPSRGEIVSVSPVAKGGSRATAGPADFEARGRILMPGFVDCHTHALWAGSRIDEWEMKLRGATYQEIAAKGGGILSTVRAVQNATDAALDEALRSRLQSMLALGTTTVEVKSGYGLSMRHELRMLRAIARVKPTAAQTIVPTALLGHAIDPDLPREQFVESTIRETLPAVAREFPGITVDAFCEQGAWTLDETVRLFEAAKRLRCPVRVHADQFTSMGMVERAISLGALSVDHLEASTDEDLRRLAASSTFGVALPCSGFHLDGRYARAGRLAREGGAVCIAANCNPGSAPCPSMPMAIALAVRHGGLTPAQAIVAATRNPAALLGLSDRGFIAPSARADLLLLNTADERALAYEFGTNLVERVWTAGKPHDAGAGARPLPGA